MRLPVQLPNKKNKAIKDSLEMNGFSFSEPEMKERVSVIIDRHGRNFLFVDYGQDTEKLITTWMDNLSCEYKDGKIVFIYN